MDAQQEADKLAELCRGGQCAQAQAQLYADHASSIELVDSQCQSAS